MSDFTELAVAGRVATPNDPDWDDARQRGTWPPTSSPSAVAFVESADDVAGVIRFAGRHGLGVAGQGTGHGAVALGPLDDVILIKTERMRGVEIDADARTARVEAGVLALELGEAARGRTACARCPAPRPTSG